MKMEYMGFMAYDNVESAIRDMSKLYPTASQFSVEATRCNYVSVIYPIEVSACNVFGTRIDVKFCIIGKAVIYGVYRLFEKKVIRLKGEVPHIDRIAFMEKSNVDFHIFNLHKFNNANRLAMVRLHGGLNHSHVCVIGYMVKPGAVYSSNANPERITDFKFFIMNSIKGVKPYPSEKIHVVLGEDRRLFCDNHREECILTSPCQELTNDVVDFGSFFNDAKRLISEYDRVVQLKRDLYVAYNFEHKDPALADVLNSVMQFNHIE